MNGDKESLTKQVKRNKRNIYRFAAIATLVVLAAEAILIASDAELKKSIWGALSRKTVQVTAYDIGHSQGMFDAIRKTESRSDDDLSLMAQEEQRRPRSGRRSGTFRAMADLFSPRVEVIDNDSPTFVEDFKAGYRDGRDATGKPRHQDSSLGPL